MKFDLHISCDNAAFEEPGELSRILRDVAEKFDGLTPADLSSEYDRKVSARDVNGNIVGYARISGKI